CARADQGPMAVVTAAGPGGTMARRLLLPAIVVPFGLGLIKTMAETRNLVHPAVSSSALILSMIAVFSTLIWWNAKALTRIDAERARVEDERLDAASKIRVSEARFRRVAESGM